MPSAQLPVSDDVGFADIRDGVWALEQELDLLNCAVGGTYFWRLVRWALYVTLANRRAPASPSSVHLSAKIRHRARSEFDACKAGLTSRPWSAAGKVDSILIPFPRKHRRHGAFVDIHSEAIFDDDSFGRFLVLERTDASARLADSAHRLVTNRDRFRPWAVARAFALSQRLAPEVSAIHAELDKAAHRIFDAPFPFSVESLCLRIALFEESRASIRRQLRRTGAKRLFAAWHDQAMFAAAQDLGLQTVELQHAAYSSSNLHYHFAGSPRVAYFADHLLTFGRYWIDSVDLPANTRPAVLGSRNISRERAMTISHDSRQALVSSQGPTDWALFDAVAGAAREAPDWTFIVRPHPRERFADYVARLANLPDAPANIRLSESAEDVYGLLRSCQVQIGVASTTLFEGMALGCRTIVFASAGSHVMADVLARGDVGYASDADQIVSQLDTAPTARDPGMYYAPPASSPRRLLS